MKLKESFLFLGSFRESSFGDIAFGDIAFGNKVFSLFFFIISFFAYSQNLSQDSMASDAAEQPEEAIISNASDIHIVGEAFVFVGDKVLASNKSEPTESGVSDKKIETTSLSEAVKTNNASQKVFVRKLAIIAPKFNSTEQDSEFFVAKALLVKVAVCSFHHATPKELYYAISIKKNLELLYQKKVYFYNSHLGKLNFSGAFSVRPPPFI